MSARRWRMPVLAVVALLVAAAIVTLWRGSLPSGDADPASYAPGGTHALAQLARDRGIDVEKTTSPDATATAVTARATVVVTRPEFVDATGWDRLAAAADDLVIVGADQPALDALGLPVRVVGSDGVEARDPGCDLPLAVTAGRADVGGFAYRGPPGSVACYGTDGAAPLLRIAEGKRVFTLIGTAAPLTNERLGDGGNAALALGLLGAGETAGTGNAAGTADVVWFVPPAHATEGGGVSLSTLLPARVWWAALQLAVAAGLLALWRSRRLGPLVPEPLPVAVPAVESVAGRGRLYRRARARGRAAAALRAGTLRRLEALTGGSLDVGDRRVHDLLYGAEPADDAALVALARSLADLERAALERDARELEVTRT